MPAMARRCWPLHTTRSWPTVCRDDCAWSTGSSSKNGEKPVNDRRTSKSRRAQSRRPSGPPRSGRERLVLAQGRGLPVGCCSCWRSSPALAQDAGAPSPRIRAEDGNGSPGLRRRPARPARCLGQPLVVGIEVEGNQRVSDADVLATIRTAVGRPLRPSQLRRDVLALYDLDFFDDIKVELQNQDDRRGPRLSGRRAPHRPGRRRRRQ